MNISKNKSLTFLSLLFISVISFVISVTSLCNNENVVLAQDKSEQVYEEDDFELYQETKLYAKWI